MYEVEYAAEINNLSELLRKAGVDATGLESGLQLMAGGTVFNAIGSPPAPPSGNRVGYAAGARGPTPMPSAYTPESITVTFPPQLVSANQVARRHYLPLSVARVLEAIAIASARRPDLAFQLAMPMKIRTLLEQNDPRDAGDGAASAEGLYSHIYTYPQVIVTYAGGDDSGYSVSHDIIARPQLVEVDNYEGPGTGALATGGAGGGGGGGGPQALTP